VSDDNEKRLEKIKKRLSKSPTAARLLAQIEAHKIDIFLKRNKDFPKGFQDAEAAYIKNKGSDKLGAVYLHQSSSDDELISYLAHELKHAQQDINGLFITNDMTPYASLIYNRFCEADAYATQFLVLRELSDAGDAEPLNHCTLLAPDQTLLIGRPANDQHKSLYILNATFNTYFRNEKLRIYYDKGHLTSSKTRLEYIFADLQESFSAVRIPRAPKQSYSKIFNRIVKEVPAEGLCIETLKKFGETAEGNYLTDIPGTSLTDPLYLKNMSLRNQFRLRAIELKYGMWKHSPRKIAPSASP